MKTRLYTVHILCNASCDDFVLVKEGFCWFSFFATVPWALYHRMWLEAAILVILQISVAILCQLTLITVATLGISLFALALVFGYLADEIRRNSLTRKGYQLEEVVLERNIDTASQRFLISRPELLTRMITHL